MINVVCLYWGNKYKTEFVNVLYNMVERHMTVPHKFIIYTDHVKMQKLVNVIAIASGAVSIALIGSGLFVYVNRDSIIDSVKQQAIEAVTGSLGGLGGGALPTGSNDLAPLGTSTSPSMDIPTQSAGLPGI